MEAVPDKLQPVNDPRAPVYPGMAAIADPEFVLNLPVAQENMQCGVAFVQEINGE